MITICDDDVMPIDEGQEAMIKRIFEQFPIQEPVHIFETIHGHIAKFNFKEGNFIPTQKDKPQRLDANDLKFWSEVGGDLRWFELGHGVIQVGLKEQPTFQVWIQGYRGNATICNHKFLGTFKADSFYEACEMAMKPNKMVPSWLKYDDGKITHYGQELFNNEAEAAKTLYRGY